MPKIIVFKIFRIVFKIFYNRFITYIENLLKNIFKIFSQIFLAILYFCKMLNTIFVDLGFLISMQLIS